MDKSSYFGPLFVLDYEEGIHNGFKTMIPIVLIHLYVFAAWNHFYTDSMRYSKEISESLPRRNGSSKI